MKSIEQGDLVISKAGRDKGEIFLVVSIENDYVLIVNGRSRKVLTPKKKNEKHLRRVTTVSYKELAEKIRKGDAVGNERVYRLLKAEKQKIQED